MPVSVTLTLIASGIALALFVAFRASITRSREGKILAFVAFLVFPALSVWAGFDEHMDRATSTGFCLSCHVMVDYGKSLHYDDRGYIPAVHYQNHLVPPDRACYTCHTDYAMFGTIKAKLHGLRHIYVQYFGNVPKPADIRLYSPFPNETCLHCHLGARKFEEINGHHKTPDMLRRVKSGQLSCVSSGCHDTIHELGDLKDARFRGAAQ
ncbi:MAG: NapC/NirT family cytochrome c [Acidobacteriota bacterium]|nr:NapC/NirT family cytochrome c [Acidobacteriota bacterium]